jgi:hypothetical protein
MVISISNSLQQIFYKQKHSHVKNISILVAPSDPWDHNLWTNVRKHICISEKTTDPETCKYTSCTVRYALCTVRYAFCTVRFLHGTIRFNARYGTLLAQYGSFLARYALLKLAARYANEVGVACTLWFRINCTILYFCSLNSLIHVVFTNHVSIYLYVSIAGSVIVQHCIDIYFKISTFWFRINCTIRYFCSLNSSIHGAFTNHMYASIYLNLLNIFFKNTDSR